MRQVTPYRRESLWDFMSDIEKTFDDLWGTPQGRQSDLSRSTGSFVPAVDLHETKDFYLISVDLPGVDLKDVKVNVEQGRLTIEGSRHYENKSDDGMFKRFERSYGNFQRSFQLPQNVDEGKIQARCENGVLEVMVPKAEVAKGRSIQVEGGKGGLFSRLLNQKDSEDKKEVKVEKH